MRQLAITPHRPEMAVLPWAIQIEAIAADAPHRLVQVLTGAILGCGGWVLSRSTNDAGVVNLVFEFERHACLDVYTVLIAAGIELNRSGHERFTELCQCTRLRTPECDADIASIELEIQTFAFGDPSLSAGVE
ncbi:MAG TPA: hypothetical protein VL967_14685 [Terracidiphilus sp.]|nr:hypothetical protein [Terracidiphilus sp.]